MLDTESLHELPYVRRIRNLDLRDVLPKVQFECCHLGIENKLGDERALRQQLVSKFIAEVGCSASKLMGHNQVSRGRLFPPTQGLGSHPDFTKGIQIEELLFRPGEVRELLQKDSSILLRQFKPAGLAKAFAVYFVLNE